MASDVMIVPAVDHTSAAYSHLSIGVGMIRMSVRAVELTSRFLGAPVRLARQAKIMAGTRAGALILSLLLGTSLCCSTKSRAQAIPDAPQDLFFRYSKTLNLSLLDTKFLDYCIMHLHPAEWLAAYNYNTSNEIRQTFARKAMLAQISNYVPSKRLMLGMTLSLGEYDTDKQRFRILYPTAGEADLLILTNEFGAGLRAAPLRAQFGVVDTFSEHRMPCTLTPREKYFSDFPGKGYLAVEALCDQNTKSPEQKLDSDTFIRTYQQYPLPRRFDLKLPDPGSREGSLRDDWNSIPVGIERASQILDETRNVFGARPLWGEFVFDVMDMDAPPLRKEGWPSVDGKHFPPDATFTIRPIAMFIWMYPREQNGSRSLKTPANFVYAIGDVKSHTSAPLDNLVTSELLAPTAEGNMAGPSSRSDIACPTGLPADAALDQCADQRTMTAQGLYLRKDGHVGHLASLPTMNTGSTGTVAGNQEQTTVAPAPIGSIKTH